MWCWFKGWRGWLPLLRFSGAPVFLPVQREKGCRAEHTEPQPAGGQDGTGQPRSEGPHAAPAASVQGAQHHCCHPWVPSVGPQPARLAGGHPAPQHEEGLELPGFPSTPSPYVKHPLQLPPAPHGVLGCLRPLGRSHKQSLMGAQQVLSAPAPLLPPDPTGTHRLAPPQWAALQGVEPPMSVVGTVPVMGSPVCLQNTRSPVLL